MGRVKFKIKEMSLNEEDRRRDRPVENLDNTEADREIEIEREIPAYDPQKFCFLF
jgi:hypothetical protein